MCPSSKLCSIQDHSLVTALRRWTLCNVHQAEASSRAEKASVEVRTLTEDFTKARLQADDVLRDLLKAQNTATDVCSQLETLSMQHDNLRREHKALAASRDGAEESLRLAEEQLQAHVRESTSALRKLEGHLQQMSATVRFQHQEIDALQSTVELQCRERVRLQEHMALQQEQTARTQGVSGVLLDESISQKQSDISCAKYEELLGSRFLTARKKGVLGTG